MDEALEVRGVKIELAIYEYGNDTLPAEGGFIRQVLPFTSDLDQASEKLGALFTAAFFLILWLNLFIADRENHRVQVFDGNGKYEAQWNNMHRPCALYCCGGSPNPQFIIGELGPGMPVNTHHTNLGPRLSIVDRKGTVIARLGGENGPGQEPGRFLSPHGLAVDSLGSIYVGEVSYTNWPSTHPGIAVPKYLRSLQKLEKVN